MSFSFLRNEQQGGLSIIYAMVVMILLFVLASALLTSFGSVLKGSTNRLTKSKTFYAAESGLELAIKDLLNDGSGSLTNISIAGSMVNTTVTGDSLLTIEASLNGISTGIQVLFEIDTTILDDIAIYSTGEVDNVNSLDSLRNYDPNLMVEHADSIPTIQYADLTNLANAQGQVQTASTFKPGDGYPNGSFYYSPGVPNVTHVLGNMQVNGGRTIYGIYVVEGNAVVEGVVMNGSARLEGVLYLPNSSSRFDGGGDPSESSVTGGIIVNGSIYGNGGHVTIQHEPEYMKIFSLFERSKGRFKLFKWVEL